MISVSSQSLTALEKQLEELIKTTERKLKNMVCGFAYEITLAASNATPIGDAESLAAGLGGAKFGPGNYARLYRGRFTALKIPTKVGYHKGAWQYSETNVLAFKPEIIAKPEDAAKAKAESDYKLGDRFFIAATGPGFEMLEIEHKSTQAPNGIIEPTKEAIQVAYKVQLPRYYRQG
jgi:hypothetical protein